MANNPSKPLSFWLGVFCFAASLATLFFQQEIGSVVGSGVMVIWMVLGGLGVYLVTKDQSNGPYNP